MQSITTSKFDSISEIELCLVIFSAEWCGPCKLLKPLLEKIATDNQQLKMFVCECDDNPELVERFGITSVPAVVFFRRGSEVGRFSGLKKRKEVQAIIDTLTE